jgi:hypothetical protein
MNNQELLSEAAEEYRWEGYEVWIRPHERDLPEFLHGFEIDLLARKPGENVIVGVRTSQQLIGDYRLVELGGRVNAEPGWRFDLLVRNPQMLPQATPLSGTESDPEEIREMFSDS